MKAILRFSSRIRTCVMSAAVDRLTLMADTVAPLGGLLGDSLAGLAGFQGFRIEEDGPQDLDIPGFRHLVESEFEGGRRGVREVGPDDEAVEITGNQEGWILQGVLVAQELVIGGLQIFPLPLVLPAEKALLPDIRETVSAAMLGRALLEAEGAPGCVCFRWSRVTHQAA